MNSLLRSHADAIVAASIREVLPDSAVQKALEGKAFPGRVILIAAGKAAWQMAKAAYDTLGERIHAGAVVTKYEHVRGPIGQFILCEGGHPVPEEAMPFTLDENSRMCLDLGGLIVLME